MMKKPKRLAALLVAAVIASALCSCAAPKKDDSDGRLKIISTVFAGYDFARAVCGDTADISLLLPVGSESHTYEPTPQDIIAIERCDLFIYVGGESEEWVERVLSSAPSTLKTLRLMDYVTVLGEETAEGMQAGGADEHDGDDGDAAEYDEHIWTSLSNAAALTKAVGSAVGSLNSGLSDEINARADEYTGSITALEGEFKDFFARSGVNTLIFGDRFPLLYFVREFSLKYYAAFPGCSAETEPSASTLAFLIDKVKSENVPAVFYIELSNHNIADAIASATGCRAVQFNTCHNVTKAQFDSGETYLSLMRGNLDTLRGLYE